MKKKINQRLKGRRSWPGEKERLNHLKQENACAKEASLKRM